MGLMINGKTPIGFIIENNEVSQISIRNEVVWSKGGGGDGEYTLSITALKNDTNVVISGWTTQDIRYSTDNKNWLSVIAETTTITLAEKQKLYIKGDNPTGLSTSYNSFINIKTNRKAIVSGNVMSLLYAEAEANTDVIPCDYCFYHLFADANYIDIDDEFKMSATTLQNSCYSAMFQSCTSLTSAPELPALIVKEHSYESMFFNCETLANVPDLKATTINAHSYQNMFRLCKGLKKAPEIYATNTPLLSFYGMFADCYRLEQGPSQLLPQTAGGYAYEAMFQNCYNLKKAPEIFATTHSMGAFNTMFKANYHLNYIKVHHQGDWEWRNSQDWLNDVALEGTFVKPSGVEIPRGTDGIPTNWTVEEY